jgi:hypothetical protein
MRAAILDYLMRYGHLPIEATLIWIIVGLHRHGVKMTFDFRVWKNGKHKSVEGEE